PGRAAREACAARRGRRARITPCARMCCTEAALAVLLVGTAGVRLRQLVGERARARCESERVHAPCPCRAGHELLTGADAQTGAGHPPGFGASRPSRAG